MANGPDYAIKPLRMSEAVQQINAIKVLGLFGIRGRIVEIRGVLGRESCGDLDLALGKLEYVYVRSLADHQYYSALRAVEAQAKLVAMQGYGCP